MYGSAQLVEGVRTNEDVRFLKAGAIRFHILGYKCLALFDRLALAFPDSSRSSLGWRKISP